MPIKILAGFASAFLFLFAITISVWRSDQELKRRLVEAEVRIEQMAIDHDNAMKTVNNAMLEREEIHAQAKQKSIELEKALEKHTNFDCLIVPDDVRVCIGADCEKGDSKVHPPADTPR